jgi:hypothetical protein
MPDGEGYFTARDLDARGYVAASRLQLDAEQHADLRTTSVEYFDSLIGSGDVDLREAGTG